ncbi:hypothetical protein AVEN_58055-1 [Araneus ventricosus]|uniref:Uncharacterized protein n=1 Tax=Araneus ventricosus TaxID=182803 RepID=A0A4Y2WUV0_ARAVE|nr:hypothetical protein AVEN_58055-1 [Araneus ventricosus]
MYVIPLSDLPCNKVMLLKLRSFDKILSPASNPLLNALKSHYKSEGLCDVFQEPKRVTILMGNERIVFPVDERAKCYLVATTLFVKNPSVFENYLKGSGRQVYDNVYAYNNSVIYLDPFDIPGPGLNYFEETESNSFHRICFVTPHVNDVYLAEWTNRQEVYELPFKTKFVTQQAKFIHYKPMDEIQLPDAHAKGTGLIHKRHSFRDPKFLLQDILNSYRGPIDHLGLLVQYPFCIGYDGACNVGNHFVALVVNGHFPKRVLQIRSPYERYIEYDFVPAVGWSQIYYERIPSTGLDRVVIESTVLGYVYKDFFLCLEHPMLGNSPTYPLQNTTYLCKPAPSSTDVFRDANIEVLDTYRYDCAHTLHRIKHRNVPQEVWCLAIHDESQSFPKRFNLPHLVDHWINFFSSNCKKFALDFTNLDVVKLALVLSKHKICYKIKISVAKNRELEMNNEELIFRLDESAVAFINDARLDLMTHKPEVETSEPFCKIS